MSQERLLPSSVDAERAVLCSMLTYGAGVIEEVAARLTAEHFFIPSHQTIFEQLLAMQAARADYPKEQMWRNSPERIAEDLLSEVTKAQTWLASKGIDFREQKKEELAEKIDPAGWREWLQDVYPTADVPAEFAARPTSVKMEFLTRRNKERKAA